MRKVFNICITKRKREPQFYTCLNYLNQANTLKDYILNVFIVGDCFYINKELYPNLSVSVIHIDTEEKGMFLKNKLINMVLEIMPSDFNYFIQMDNDLIINPELFKQLDTKEQLNSFYVLGGVKLTENSSRIIYAELPTYTMIQNMEIDQQSKSENDRQCYVGNIAATKYFMERYKEVIGNVFRYDEGFKSWGGDDSVLSISTTHMKHKGLINKEYLKDSWFHLHHNRFSSEDGFSQEQYNKNVELMNTLVAYNKKKIDSFINK
jgi:hypothetical protein